MPFLPHRLYLSSGLPTLLHQPHDTHLLCLTRFLRMLGYGSTALILALFLSALGTPDSRIGLFMTLTLLGDVVISFILTLFADALGRRKVLVLGSAMMCVSGVVFAAFPGRFWVLVVASVVGVISPSGNEIGPFRAVEESTLAQLCGKSERSDIFAWYNLIGMAGAAVGQVGCGWVVQTLRGREGWTEVGAYRVVFTGYAVLGLVKVGVSLGLSKGCEVVRKVVEVAEPGAGDGGGVGEHLLSDGNGNEDDEHALQDIPKDDAQATTKHQQPPSSSSTPRPRKSFLTTLLNLIPPISPRSRGTLLRLCLLFAVDSFASGLVTTSWQTYFFTLKFSLSAATLGTLFSVASLIASLSNLFAASLAKRIGLIKTMVFTHLPSAVFLALIPSTPYLPLAASFLFLRSCTSTMDAAPRQAFLSMAVLSEERTAVMGVVNVVKTLSQSAGPSVTGHLVGKGKFWVVFVCAGALKAGYDLSMLALFLGFRAPEEEG